MTKLRLADTNARSIRSLEVIAKDRWTDDETTPTWQDWAAGVSLAILLLLLCLFWGCGSTTAPTPPLTICPLVHHPDESVCQTVFPSTGPPILQCQIIPAHDGPDRKCP